MSDDTYADFEPEDFHEGNMVDFDLEVGSVEDKAEADIQYLTRWTNSFPKPEKGQAVRADKLLGALKELEPIAKKIAQMKDGKKKGGYSGAGYLTGPTITRDDKVQSNRILYEIEERLPWYGSKPVERDLLEQIRGASQRVLMIACDININETLLDKASRGWEAQSEAVIEAPELLLRAATEPWLLRMAWDETKKKAADSGIGLAEIAVFGALGIGAAYVAVKLVRG